MTKTNVQPTPSNSQHHDTPNNKTHVIKFRVTAEEKTSLELTCKLLNLSLSTFIRRAIHNVKIEKTAVSYTHLKKIKVPISCQAQGRGCFPPCTCGWWLIDGRPNCP